MKYATNLGFHWEMTTTGILFNDTLIQNLKDTKLQSVSISIDGLEKTQI